MNVKTRLLAKPVATLLWVLLVAVMTGFLTVGAALMFSSGKLSKSLDESHTAIAVRTDPAVITTRTSRGNMVESEDGTRPFTAEDAEYFSSLDSVKAVRNNTLSGATSPSFNPVVGLEKWRNWLARGQLTPYCNIVVVGTVIKTGRDNDRFVVGISIEDIPYISAELKDAEDVLRYIGGMAMVMQDNAEGENEGEGFFEEGKRYVFSGYFNPQWMTGRYAYMTQTESTVAYWAYLGTVYRDGEMLIGVPFETSEDEAEKSIGSVGDYCFPAAQELSGDVAALFSADGIWKNYLETWEKQMHSLPVIGTERLETMYGFLKGEIVLSEGRTFTYDEYERGERVLVLSETVANSGSLKVGDRITLNQYVCTGDRSIGTNESIDSTNKTLNNPCVDYLNMNTAYSSDEEFTIVGIYRMSEKWSYGAYSITPNTVFIPQKAQIDGAFGKIGETEELYGIYLGLELENGSVEDFRLAVSSSPYAGQFYAFDQGYETVQKSMNSLASSSRRLMIVAVIGWVLFLLLLLVMYQASQQRNIGIMRSLGNAPGKVTKYLFSSGFAVAVLGVLIATVASVLIMHVMQNKILADAVAGLDQSAFSGQLAVPVERMGEMVQSSMPRTGEMALFVLVQLVLIAIPMLVQAIVLAKKNPRTLVKG